MSSLLLEPGTRVTCPKCEHEFSLEEGFARQALESVETASARALGELKAAERAAAEKRAKEMAAEREKGARQEVEELKKLLQEQGDAHAKALAEVRRMAEEGMKPQLEALRRELAGQQERLKAVDQREAAVVAREQGIEARIMTEAAHRAAELFIGEKEAYDARLAEREQQLQVLRSEQVTLRQERQALQDEKASLTLEVQRQVDARTAERETQVRAQEQERAGLEKAELQKKLDDLNGQLIDAQRRLAQGSQQMQGEVLEVAIEERLKVAFPLDTIEEVKKGQRGGDVLQHVVTRAGQAAGTILWEMKRAKDWQVPWTGKLKDDMRASGAAVGVLVTMPGALPKDWPAAALFALYEDVWVTQVSTAIGLGEALRAGLIDVHRQRVAAAGKGEKAEALYDYLTSPQFAQKLKAVYETFTRMREELETEKNVTIQRWARREKQLEQGRTQLLHIGGEIQGLAQVAVPQLEMEPAATTGEDT